MPGNAKRTFLKASRKTLMEIAGTVKFVTVRNVKYTAFSKSFLLKHA